MLKINIVLVLCVVGLCTAATTPKPKMAAGKSKIVKGKRDAAIEGTPYSYDQPQKSYQVYTHQQQQKAAMVEYHQGPQKAAQVEFHQAPQKAVQVEYQQPQQKVAPLNHYEKLQAASLQSAAHQNAHVQGAPQHAAQLQVQPQEQHYEQVQQYQFPAGFQSGGESLYANSPYKYEYNYVPSYEIEKMPAVHYSQDINNPFLGYSDFKSVQSPQYASYKPSSPYQQEYSFESPAPAHNFQSHSYLVPQQNEHLHQAYLAEYASQGGAGQPAHYYGGFSQQPSALFIPQTVAIPAKPAKVPDYASGLKGLGHYSTVSSPAGPAPTNPAYHKQTYEVPSFVQYSHSQTERPFKASAYLGSTQLGHDSYSEQSISNAKPAGQYLPPSKTYLPAKEQQQYVAPSKTYLPAKEQQQYVAPSSAYLPAKEQQHHYAPAKQEQQYLTIKEQHHYVPSKEQYAPSKEYHYVPEQSPVEYQIEYIQAPAKNYLPAASVASNYYPSKAEQPKGSYLPPKKTYLPPSNPYQTSYQSGAAQQGPVQQYQYQQQDSYESAEYQSVTPSGHK